jgi:hypothetical protein
LDQIEKTPHYWAIIEKYFAFAEISWCYKLSARIPTQNLFLQFIVVILLWQANQLCVHFTHKFTFFQIVIAVDKFIGISGHPTA